MKKWIVLKDQRLGEGEGNISIQVFANQIIEGNPEEFFAFNKKIIGVKYKTLFVSMDNLKPHEAYLNVSNIKNQSTTKIKICIGLLSVLILAITYRNLK